jgi:hypothetical protein
MPTKTVTVLPTASHASLVQTSPSLDVPANLLGFVIRMISTEFTDPSLTCALQVDESYDNGQSWQNIAGMEAVGGFYSRPSDPRFGQPLQPSLNVDLSQQQRDAALLRARWTSQGTWVYGLALDQLT